MNSFLTHEFFAVGIDLGSNTLRIAAIACDSGEILYSDEVIVRTADGLAAQNRISDAAVERIIAGLEGLLAPLAVRPERMRAVTTEALRRASNAEAVLSEIAARSGIRFEIIDGREEAALTLLAVEKRLKRLGFDAECFVLADIGGGSTELSVKVGNEAISQSFPLGIVTLTEEAEDAAALDGLLTEKLLPMQTFWHSVVSRYGEIDLFVATAGTPTTIAAMKLDMQYTSYDSAKINGTVLYREDLALQYSTLLQMSSEARKRTVGTGREDLISTGIKIFDAIYALLEKEQAVVIDDGLREGVALALCSV